MCSIFLDSILAEDGKGGMMRLLLKDVFIDKASYAKYTITQLFWDMSSIELNNEYYKIVSIDSVRNVTVVNNAGRKMILAKQ